MLTGSRNFYFSSISTLLAVLICFIASFTTGSFLCSNLGKIAIMIIGINI